MAEWIEEEFGEKLTFYTYGRQGATIAPSEYMHAAACGSFGRLNLYASAGPSAL